MKKLGFLVLGVLLYLFAVLVHMFLWTRYEFIFPTYPSWFVDVVYLACKPIQQPCGAELAGDLYLLLGSLINVGLVFLLGYFVILLIRKKKKKAVHN